MPIPAPLDVGVLGRADYEPVWRQMQAYTDDRGPETPDAVWYVEHPPVFTQGLNGRPEHVLAPGDIPVVAIDRGGQITYHGPGQLVVYPMLDLRRRRIGVRDLVTALEQSVVDTLAEYRIDGAARADAPGVYVDGRKVASIGLRVRRGCSYHGLAFNVNLDLEPFSRINPCGFKGLEVTSLAELGVTDDLDAVRERFHPHLLRHLGQTTSHDA
ncbi:MAG: lipoyl(octanoyl) transferase LipB [Pseudomonadota bacterium]